ncbi:MAG: hypothetical protein JWO38_4137 [Gemmataceae bacterium]|nr:hypothetical protein [Gemmataceae bacterium]
MSARRKLNAAYAYGSVVWAAFVGAVFQSWALFAVVLGVLVGLNLVGGNIRLAHARR